MSNIVERLRSQGKDAFHKHYSLGMWKLCADGADEIDKLRSALTEIASGYVGDQTAEAQFVWAQGVAREALGED